MGDAFVSVIVSKEGLHCDALRNNFHQLIYLPLPGIPYRQEGVTKHLGDTLVHVLQ